MTALNLMDEFASEAQEHLMTAEDDVLALEQRADDSRKERIDCLFRALHTIKGGAACLNMSQVKELAHAMENIVGYFRDGKLEPSAHITQTLLDGLDKLKTLIQSGETSLSDVEPIIAELKTITPQQTVESLYAFDLKPTNSRIFDLANIDMSVAVSQRLYVYEMTLDLEKELKRSKCGSQEIVDKINSLGLLLASTLAEIPDTINVKKQQSGSFLCGSVIDDPQILFPGLEVEPTSFFMYTPIELLEHIANPTLVVQNDSQKTMNMQEDPALLAQTDPIPLPPLTIPEEVKPKKNAGAKPAEEQTIRIPVEIVDKLMNLAGELVVVRNRNAQVLASGNTRELSTVNQRLDAVTNDIQTTVMQTRMRPVGTVFSRFTRVIRDLGRQLGKEINLEICGADVELDKSIIDGLFEPLTHLVRNSVDHGIENHTERERLGKPATGLIRLSAKHQTGQVNILVTDDGKGIDPVSIRAAAVKKNVITQNQADVLSDRESLNLIFLPGFSTAETITDVSGRGVGMDAVKSSLQKLGGIVEILSTPGHGMTITIRLPLTLAIIPALILTVERQCFAIPQVNVEEVVWLHGDEVYQSIRMVDNKEVFWLRGKMLPIMRLTRVLGMDRSYKDPASGEFKKDRRAERPDRRQSASDQYLDMRKGPIDRRTSLDNSLYIIILTMGRDSFGLCVEKVVDTEEIVVKPLHERLKESRVYAGVTVLGDGAIAMILDIMELAQKGGMHCDTTESAIVKAKASEDERQKMLVFTVGGTERFALPLSLLMRVDEVNCAQIQHTGIREYLRFRDSLIPLIRLENSIAGLSALYGNQYLYAIIPKIGNPLGIAAAEILDIRELNNTIEPGQNGQTLIIGSQLVDGYVTSILDLCTLIETAEPGRLSYKEGYIAHKTKLLVVDDSSFFRALISSYLRGIGLQVQVATNGHEALDFLESNKVNGIISDIEMPEMDGFELARRLKAHKEFCTIPLLGMSGMDSSVVRPRALSAGFDDFQSKSNLPSLVSALEALLPKMKVR